MAQSPYLDQNAPEILALERQKKLADLLQSRALEQPQGQMVSGRYVAPSLVQQLAPLANAYMGRKAGEDVESRQSKLANLIRGQNVAETKDILETMYGKQGQEVPMVAPSTDADAQPSGFYGDKPSVEMQGAVAPDKMSALLKSLNAQSTGGQSLAPTILAQLNAKPAFHTVAPGASLLQETPTGVKPVYTSPKEIETPNEIKAAAFRLGINPNPSSWTPEQRIAIDQKVKQDKLESKSVTNVNVMPEQKVFENTQKLRSEFRAEPIYKAHQEVQSAFNQVKDGLEAKSPAGDLAAATKFMKLLDPGSVVRESELALAMQAGGALDRLTSYASNVATGKKLTDKQREDFKNLSTKFFNTSAQLFNEKQKEFSDIAKRYDFNPKDVTGEPVKLQGGKPNNAITATNQQTGQKIMSTDGGKTWKPMEGQ